MEQPQAKVSSALYTGIETNLPSRQMQQHEAKTARLVCAVRHFFIAIGNGQSRGLPWVSEHSKRKRLVVDTTLMS